MCVPVPKAGQGPKSANTSGRFYASFKRPQACHQVWHILYVPMQSIGALQVLVIMKRKSHCQPQSLYELLILLLQFCAPWEAGAYGGPPASPPRASSAAASRQQAASAKTQGPRISVSVLTYWNTALFLVVAVVIPACNDSSSSSSYRSSKKSSSSTKHQKG